MYFHTDDPDTLKWIATAAEVCIRNGRSLRLDVDDKGRLRYKVQGGMWSEPIESTFDLSRDKR